MFALRAAPEQACGLPARTAQHPAWSGGSARSAAGFPAARCPHCQRLRPGRNCPGPGGQRSPCPPWRSCGDSECGGRAQGPCPCRDCREAAPSQEGKLAWRGTWVTRGDLQGGWGGGPDPGCWAGSGDGEMRVKRGRTSARSVPLCTPVWYGPAPAATPPGTHRAGPLSSPAGFH